MSPEELRKLVERACEQPGICALMEVYKTWSQYDKAIQPHLKQMEPRRVVWDSDMALSETSEVLV